MGVIEFLFWGLLGNVFCGPSVKFAVGPNVCALFLSIRLIDRVGCRPTATGHALLWGIGYSSTIVL